MWLMPALPLSDAATSQTDLFVNLSSRVTLPIPGLMSGVSVYVGTASCVAVAEGGNQTIVGVGVAVSVGTGVSVGSIKFTGRQAPRKRSPHRRKRIQNTFI